MVNKAPEKTKNQLLRERVWERDKGVCWICRRGIAGGFWYGNWNLDHLIPRSMGGPRSFENLRVTHRMCNLQRQNKMWWRDPITWELRTVEEEINLSIWKITQGKLKKIRESSETDSQKWKLEVFGTESGGVLVEWFF